MGKCLNKEITRRDLLKAGGLGASAVIIANITGGLVSARGASDNKRLAMVIDLHRCVGCGACLIACKNENNVQEGVAWAGKIVRTVGKFPNVRYEVYVTLCNHCEKAPCVTVCPTKAMHKGYGNITAHDPGKCVGCRYCMVACPYNVIKFNWEKTHKFWRDEEPTLNGITSSPVELTKKVGGTVIPYYNPARENARKGSGLRTKGIVEKCTLCEHKVKNGELPYCVEACPANARIFGDLNDPTSEINNILAKYHPYRLKEELGTQPKVFYVRSFNPGTYPNTKGSI